MLTRQAVEASEPGHGVEEWMETARRLGKWLDVLTDSCAHCPGASAPWGCEKVEVCPLQVTTDDATAWLDGETRGGTDHA